MVGMVSGHHIMISTTLLANFDVCQKIFIRGTSCFGFEAEPHTRGGSNVCSQPNFAELQLNPQSLMRVPLLG